MRLIDAQVRSKVLADDIGNARARLLLRGAEAPHDADLRLVVQALARRAVELTTDATTNAPTSLVHSRESASRQSKLLGGTAAFVKPLAIPAAIAYDCALRSLELHIVAMCRNFAPPKVRSNKGRKSGAAVDPGAAVATQTRQVDEFWRRAVGAMTAYASTALRLAWRSASATVARCSRVWL